MMFVDYVNEKIFSNVSKMGEEVCHVEVDFGQHIVKLPHVSQYATDVTIQHYYQPAGSKTESKCFFSKYHKLRGYITEVSVLPNGISINYTVHGPVLVSDTAIFRRNHLFHRLAMKETVDEVKCVGDFGPLQE